MSEKQEESQSNPSGDRLTLPQTTHQEKYHGNPHVRLNPIGCAEQLLRSDSVPKSEFTGADVRGPDVAWTWITTESRRLRTLVENAPGFVAVGRGPAFVFELANKAYYDLVGNRDILGKSVREALPELAEQGFYELLEQVYQSGEAFIGRAVPIQIQPASGGSLETRHIDFIYQPIIEQDDTVSGVFVQGQDVTEAHELSQELSRRAVHDTLTGLCNRQEFERKLKNAIDELTATEVHSVLYLDLDQFKIVNDTCGHRAGDELVRMISMVLRSGVRPSDTLARLGGDEFAVLLEGCSGPMAERIAEELRQAVNNQDFFWRDRIFGGSVSIGLISIDDRTTDHQVVLSAVDSACFLAKDKGRNRVQVYRHECHELASRWRDMDLIGQIRTALREERIELYWQRIEALKAGEDRWEHYEVLLRLRDKSGRLVPPMGLIPAAERYGLMPAVDRYVIRKAFEYLALQSHRNGSLLTLSVNLSGTSFNDEAFVPFIGELVGELKVTPAQICFEVTETAAVTNLAKTADVIRDLKAYGFRFALDDFGSGMSSFCYLRNLPVDYVKIDGVFVRHILDDEINVAIVTAIVQVANAMGIQTVAEYVEDDEVRAFLANIGVDYGQGYGIHKPEPLC